ncbi:Uncharacterised protein [Mycoplasmopsis maculosa]|uniref:Uncharacterized protein n=1 Tax=Mycoplasmopsis maculosa TaxID=114885 RepID=A0A449B486_9BACT|nr:MULTISPECIES: hypothetical protein [Mycoplasmopsis]WQQ16130.1 hypothetical protein RRG51_03915 [Mycoplasmopsis cynos]VEU75386.1 Uncharacterised protein [Mycoplasmopsis maculosa]
MKIVINRKIRNIKELDIYGINDVFEWDGEEYKVFLNQNDNDLIAILNNCAI